MATKKSGSGDRAKRLDGWINVLTGLGLKGRDKRKSSSFQREVLTYHDLAELYRGSDMASRIVDLPADEATREWISLTVDENSELATDVTDRVEELDAQSAFCEADKWARLFGGGAILLGVDDGQNPRLPLDDSRIRSFDWMTVLDCRELRPLTWYGQPLAPKFGRVQTYQIQPQTGDVPDSGYLAEVHESRVLRFDGVKLTRLQERQNENVGWGDSVLQRCHQVIRDYEQTWEGAAALMQDFAQAVYKIEGLADAIAANEDDLITRRMQIIDASRSLIRGVLLDAEHEDFKREVTPITGVPEFLDKFAIRLAASARMPVSLLMGQAPAGLNATGDSDVRFFYDGIRAQQKNRQGKLLERFLRLLFLTKNGPSNGAEPEGWKAEWVPLWQPTPTEKAALRKTEAETDKIEIDSGVVLPEEVAIARHSDDGMIDVELRREMLEVQKEKATEPPPTSPPPPQPNAGGPVPPTVEQVAPAAKPAGSDAKLEQDLEDPEADSPADDDEEEDDAK